jgi:putative aldouronate transport system substrate-binding protein
MPLAKDLYDFYEMAPAFHVTPKIWVDDGTGKLVYGSTVPAMKTMLAKWAQWHKDGLLRPDWVTLDWNAKYADVLTGVVGVAPGENWMGWVIQDTFKNTGDNTWLEAYELPTIDGQPAKFGVPFVNGRNNVVNPKAKNPEVLIKLINFYAWFLNASIPEGSKTIDDIMPFTVNNMHHITGPFKVEFASYQDTKEVNEAVKSGVENPKFSSGYAYSYYTETMKWVKDKDIVGLGRYLQMANGDKGGLFRGTKHVDNGQILKDKLWGAPTKAQLDFGTTLDELLVVGFTKIITGEQPVDYFDQLIEEWKTAGGDQVTQAVNEQYGK